jgi:hypothetical protein
MSQIIIGKLIRCVALALPVFLLSVQPMLASENNSVSSPGVQKQQPAPENVLRVTVSKPDELKPANNTFVQPQAGNRNYVYFNLVNRSSVIFTELYMRPSGTSTLIYFNFIGGNLIPGEIQTVTLTNYNTCYYDILVRNSNGDQIVDDGINFCKINNYILND